LKLAHTARYDTQSAARELVGILEGNSWSINAFFVTIGNSHPTRTGARNYFYRNPQPGLLVDINWKFHEMIGCRDLHTEYLGVENPGVESGA
jgi:hypothetical protein